MTKVVSPVSRGQGHEFLNKLEAAGLDSDLAQRVIDSRDNVLATKVVELLQNGGRVEIMTTDGIVAPQGGRIHILSVPVDESRDWQEAVKAAGPNTPDNYDVRKVGDQYPTKDGQGIQQIVLVNFSRVMSSQDVFGWAKTNHLRLASPRAVFAIGEHQPTLNKTLGMNTMAVVSLQDYSFEGDRQVCSVWGGDSERGAGLLWLGYGWVGHYWFAFVRE